MSAFVESFVIPTKNHKTIQRWVEKHDGVPAEVIPFIFDSEPSVLRFLFAESVGGTAELRPITWANFFARLDLLGLSVAFDEEAPIYEIVRVIPRSKGDMN